MIKRNLQYLYVDQEVKKVFTPAPFVFFRSARNLKSFGKKCNRKRCLVCLNFAETDTFESFQTKKQYKINHNLNCNDKCLIYPLSCKICGLQYVGSTTDPFRYRWNNYKDNNRKAEREVEHIEADLFEHFSSREHSGFLEDCTITLIDKTEVQIPLEEKNIGEGY